jgi:uncharacterized membrane protein/protein-disulfide isomerase
VRRATGISTLIAALSAAAAILAAFLLWQSFSDASVPGCGAGSGCDAVLSSRWSRIGPIPVSAAALPVFLLMAFLATGTASYLPRRRDLSWRALPALAIIAAGAAVWFLSLQAFIIHHFCTYCTITHALALSASLLIFRQWFKLTAHEPRSTSLPPIIAAILLLLAMISTQLLFEPKLYTVTQGADPTPQSSPQTIPNPSTPRLSLNDGRISIDPSAWPIFGTRRAQFLIVMMFDYTCDHCRREYPLLQQARQRYGTQIAIIAIPVPLEPACNPAVPRAFPEHINACTYIRYALAVWKADPASFEQFHNRLMEGDRPPPLEQAREYAEELVTPSSFAAALADPSVEKHIQDSVQLYRDAGAGPIPKLILPKAMISGEIHPLQHMFEVLESHLDIKPIR